MNRSIALRTKATNRYIAYNTLPNPLEIRQLKSFDRFLFYFYCTIFISLDFGLQYHHAIKTLFIIYHFFFFFHIIAFVDLYNKVCIYNKNSKGDGNKLNLSLQYLLNPFQVSTHLLCWFTKK